MTIPDDNSLPQQPAIDHCWQNIGVMGDGSCPQLESVIHCRNCEVFTAAGQRLFEGLPPAEYVDQQTVLLAEKLDADVVGSEAMVLFRIDKEWLALAVDVVTEVAEPRTIHRVPHRSDRLLMGIANVRGELQLCVSLRKLLGITDGEHSSENGARALHDTLHFLVCEQDGQRWAFAVDEVLGVHRVKVNQLENVPSTIAKSMNRLINAVFSREGNRVGRLDQDRLFDLLQGGVG